MRVDFNVKANYLNFKNGADPFTHSCGSNTLLHEAARCYNIEAIKELVQLGIDINVENKEGQTPLFAAAISGSIYGHKEAVQELIRLGAKVTVEDKDGMTILEIIKLRMKNEMHGIDRSRGNLPPEMIKSLKEINEILVNAADNEINK